MKHRDGKSLLVTGGTGTASTEPFTAPTCPDGFAETSDTRTPSRDVRLPRVPEPAYLPADWGVKIRRIVQTVEKVFR